LEQIARVGTLEGLKEMVYVKAGIESEAVHRPPHDARPPDWNSHPPGTASQCFGDDWLSSRSAVCLRIPSVILPEGCNFMLNPAHPDFSGALQVNDALPLQLDPRILD
ncbi:MAG: RES family NAD+ phosphorylase, partial [Rhodothermales bacterium]